MLGTQGCPLPSRTPLSALEGIHAFSPILARATRCSCGVQVSSMVEDARHAASSLQKTVSRAWQAHGGQPEQEFSMGMRAGPRPTAAPRRVQLLQSGASTRSCRCALTLPGAPACQEGR